MITKKNYYYIAYLLFDNGTLSVFGLKTRDADEELVRSHFQFWSRSYVGMSLEILELSPITLSEYKRLTSKINW